MGYKKKKGTGVIVRNTVYSRKTCACQVTRYKYNVTTVLLKLLIIGVLLRSC